MVVHKRVVSASGMVLGNQVLLRECPALIKGRRLGLLTNHTGVTADLVPLAEILRGRRDADLRALFSPEHGLGGEGADGAPVPSGRDPATGLPVHSLYGRRRRPSAAHLRGIDLLLVDLQDVGARFYTYATTLAWTMEACAAAGVAVVVLDRPNPIGGRILEGPVLDPAFASFVGAIPVPIRHGLTIGELARLANARAAKRAGLAVIPMRGWRRGTTHDATGLPWVPPSPALPTFESALAYPGFCLFEGTNLSEGRGTAPPFRQIGAPWVDGPRLARILRGRRLPGCRFPAVRFVPAESKGKGKPCAGVLVQVTDPGRFRPVTAALHVLAAVRELHPRHFRWGPGNERSGPKIPFIDLLAGTDALRRDIERGKPVAEIVGGWKGALARFVRDAGAYRLYD